jgi:hypothetical protein
MRFRRNSNFDFSYIVFNSVSEASRFSDEKSTIVTIRKVFVMAILFERN